MFASMPSAARSDVPGTLALTVRALVAACVLLSAVVHLFLWATGMKSLSVVGPAFALNAFGGILLGVVVLAWYDSLALLGAMAFGAATLVAFVVSTTPSGFFNVHEVWSGVPQLLAAGSEIGAIVLAGVGLFLERRRSAATP